MKKNNLKTNWFFKTMALAFLLFCSTGSYAQVTHVNSQTARVAGTSLNIPKPVGLQVGDLMIVNFNIRQGGSTPTSTNPTGWTMRAAYNHATPDRWVWIASKVATAADVSATSFNFSRTGADDLAGGISAFRNVDTAVNNGVYSVGPAYAADNTNPIAPTSINTANNNDLVMMLGQVQSTNFNGTNGWRLGGATGAQMTAIYELNPGSEVCGVGAAIFTRATAGASGVGYKQTADGRKAGMLLAIKSIQCPITATVSSINISSVCGTTTGSITISNPSGLPAGSTYQFRLNSGAWTTTTSYTGLAAGSYTVQARNSSDTSCTVTLQTVTISNVNNDNDCDGVPDDIDLDDDNDGILDSVECSAPTPVSGGISGPITNFTTSISSTNPSSATVPHTLNSITVGGTTYNDFIVPDSYTPGFTNPNNAGIRLVRNGNVVYDFSRPTWSQDILNDAFRSRNLGAYQDLTSQNFADGDFYILSYNTPKIINGGVFLAVTERNGNNPQIITALDVNNTVIGTINVANANYVNLNHNVVGTDPVEMALFPLEDFGPLGSQIKSLRISFPASETSDGADSKVFIFGDILLAEGDNDFDGDGRDACFDNDSDNDGIFDAMEANASVTLAQLDSNGRFLGGVDPNTGIPLAANGGAGFTPLNTVSSTSPNYINLDSDGDGCSDANEFYNNTNADGGDGFAYGVGTPAVNAFGNVITASYNGNDIANTRDNTVDVCTVDPCDAVASGNLDTDGDGISDVCDQDDDNDGILDVDETNITNTNIPLFNIPQRNITGNAGTTDIYNVNLSSTQYNIGDNITVSNLLAAGDFGLTTETFSIEFNGGTPITGLTVTAPDADANGDCGSQTAPSGFTPQNISVIDIGGGVPGIRITTVTTTAVNNICSGNALTYTLNIDAISNQTVTDIDTDNDGVFDRLDNDSDNDGVPDSLEADSSLTPEQIDVNGRLTGPVDLATGIKTIAGSGFTPVDTDGDGVRNYVDIDSDNDGIVDVIESQPTVGYKAPTGIVNSFGIDNAFNSTGSGVLTTTLTNTDGTDVPDMLDADSDNDGITDMVEAAQGAFAAGDTDGDGLANIFDDVVLSTSPTTNSTNGGQTAINPFPVTDNPGGEPNWRNKLCLENPSLATATSFGVVGISTHATKQANWPGNLANGVLVIESATKGFVITRITTAARDDTSFVPVEGMLIYNTTENRFQLRTATGWVNLKRGCND